jgi:chemotaxis protein histidine kinase CheA
MGGTLSAKSDGPDRGATFTLELPLTAATAAEQLIAQREGKYALDGKH